MARIQLTSPRLVQEILARHGLRPQKKMGQNFLIDENTLGKIVRAAQLEPGDTVLEIGPGLGTLTAALAQEAGRVVAVELDRGLIPVLKENLAAYSNIKIVQGDILKIDMEKLVDSRQPLKVVANLPYYITSPVIMTLLESPLFLERLVIMVQREVAQRLVASPGSKDYGVLSVAVEFYTEGEIIKVVPPTVFYPRPEVDSAVVRLKVRPRPPCPVGDKATFFRLVRGAFRQRRKTLLNNLQAEFKGEFDKEELVKILKAGGIDPGRRGETLSLEEFATLARIITKRDNN